MEHTPHLGCVVMAAGNARRFGANKLSARWDGKPLIRRAMEAIPGELYDRRVVVTQYPEVAELARELSFTPIENNRPDLGISHTISLGLAELADCDAVLFQVSDQPLLRRETVAELTRFYLSRPDHIAALGHNGVRGNPCIFPARFFPELLELTGDRGGSAVIRRHPEALALWETDAPQLADVDTPAALEALRQSREN